MIQSETHSAYAQTGIANTLHLKTAQVALAYPFQMMLRGKPLTYDAFKNSIHFSSNDTSFLLCTARPFYCSDGLSHYSVLYNTQVTRN